MSKPETPDCLTYQCFDENGEYVTTQETRLDDPLKKDEAIWSIVEDDKGEVVDTHKWAVRWGMYSHQRF